MTRAALGGDRSRLAVVASAQAAPPAPSPRCRRRSRRCRPRRRSAAARRRLAEGVQAPRRRDDAVEVSRRPGRSAVRRARHPAARRPRAGRLLLHDRSAAARRRARRRAPHRRPGCARVDPLGGLQPGPAPARRARDARPRSGRLASLPLRASRPRRARSRSRTRPASPHGGFTADALDPPLVRYLAQLRRAGWREAARRRRRRATSRRSPPQSDCMLSLRLRVTGTIGTRRIDVLVGRTFR